MRNYIHLYVIGLFIFSNSITYSQQINFNKDTVFFKTPNMTEDCICDTLVIWNTGSEVLTIDRIYSVSETYSYGVIIYSKNDTSYFVISPAKWPILYNINPNDSTKLIIQCPDLCFICKLNSAFAYFEDTLVFISNSIENDSVNIFSHGFGISTKIQDVKSEVLESFALYQNYPNPFNLTTTIRFRLSKPAFVTLILYNSLGIKVNTLFFGKLKGGTHKVTLNADRLPSGVYYYVMIANGRRSVKKCIVLK